MSTARLNVWVTALGDACHIARPLTGRWFFVHITVCTGKGWRGAERSTSFLAAKCGQVEIEIPPGCYGFCQRPGARTLQRRWC